MTFYHILFGALFLGAVKELFSNIGPEPGHLFDWQTTLFPEALTLVLVVFCDIMFTSVVIESKGEDKKNYKSTLMLLDGLNFFLLAFAVLTIMHSEGNEMMSIHIGLPLYVFWVLIGAYFPSLAIWNYTNKTCGALQGWHKHHYKVQIFMAILAAVIALIDFHLWTGGRLKEPGKTWAWLYAILAMAYLVNKIFLIRKLESTAKQGKAKTPEEILSEIKELLKQ